METIPQQVRRRAPVVLDMDVPKFDEQLQSISSSSIEQLLPVSFSDPDIERDYRTVFYPARNVAARAAKRKQLAAKKALDSAGLGEVSDTPDEGVTDRKHYAQLCMYLASVSAATNVVLALARYIVLNSRDFATRNPKEVQLLTEQTYKLLQQSSDAVVDAYSQQFIEILNGGKSHVIKPSTRYKDGFDVLFSGLPAFGNTKGTAVSVTSNLMGSYEIPTTSTSYAYKQAIEEGGIYNNVYCEAAIAMCNTLAPGASIETAHTRQVTPVDLNFDFRGRIAKALAHPKMVALGFKLETNCPQCPTDVVAGLAKYFSVIVIREANHQAVRAKTLNPAQEMTAVNAQQLALSPTIGYSVSMNLPSEIVSFITQTPKGKQPSLVALNTWVSVWSRALWKSPTRKRGKDTSLEISQGRITPVSCPKYVLSASQLKTLNEARKKLGFYSEEGRTNADGIYVSNLGTLNFCPKSSEMVLDNAIGYEKALEEALQLAFDAGTPLAVAQEGETNPVFGLASPDYKKGIANAKLKLKKYAGSVQGYSWDYNCILTSAMSDPEKLQPMSTAGATVPDSSSIGDYLRRPFAESMSLMFPHATLITAGGTTTKVNPATFGHGGSSCVSMLNTSLFMNTAVVYTYLLSENAVPSFQKLVSEAAKEMNITKLDEDEERAVIEKNLYTGVLSNDLVVTTMYAESATAQKQVEGLFLILSKVLRDCSGMYGSNLARYCTAQNIPMENSDYFFNPEQFSLDKFKNVYKYFGGHVFYKMMQALALVDKKKLMVVNVDNPMPAPNFVSIVRDVLPLAIMLSKYVPSSETILEEAEKLAEGYKKNDSITVDDIHVPGSSANMQMFPQQIAAHMFLRNHPRFAVLDIDPGGGKTVTTLTDLCALIFEKKVERPLVICPNGLVRNWIEDLHKITNGSWNAIPVTTEVFNSPYWGDDRLTKLISSAPKNTIVVAGLSALKIRPYTVVIGSHAERLSEGLEFLKKFGFDYVAIDECHRVKNANRNTHKVAKQVATASCVKYIRLLTGTLLSDRLVDIVGQSAMFSAQIFRTAKEFEQDVSDQLGDVSVPAMPDRKTPGKLARERLMHYSAVISAKRKEWAFMLPVPAEELIPVSMVKPESEGGNAHQLMYDAVLKVTMDEIKADADIKRLLSGGDDDDGGDDEGDEGEDTNTDDLDDATLAELESKLKPRLARLEQMLTDPLGDEFGSIFFKGIGADNFVSNKVLKVIERIRLSFIERPWKKGAEYYLRPYVDEEGNNQSRSVVDYDGVRYILMPDKDIPYNDPKYYAPYISTIEPSKDPRWKVEPRGKVLVFCRYNRTTEAIYRALPPDLKKIAATFCGTSSQALDGAAETNKWDNLAAFKNDKWSKTNGVQILIANEQAISEGHNLQMADRQIRVESPWTPGELSQAQARIFRPDPDAANRREIVYLDWILTNNSMEVAKIGRLISKMIVKTQFDEADNPLYARLNSDEHQLPLIRMSLEMFQAVPNLEDIKPYTDTYGVMAQIQSHEFRLMRATRPSIMVTVPQTPQLADAKILEQVPYIENLKVPDRHNFGLIPLNSYLSDPDSADGIRLAADPSKLVGMYANTELGNGTIVDVRVARNKFDNAHPKISSMKIKLAGSDEIYDAVPSKVYLATKLDAKTIKSFQTKPWMSKADQKRADIEAEREAKRVEREQAAAERRAAKEEAELARMQAMDKAQKAKTKAKAKPVPEPEPEENNNLELYPVVYNAQLAFEAVVEDKDIDLRPYKFREFGSYASCTIKDQPSFIALLKWLDSKFYMSKPVRSRLEILEESFASGRGRKFAVEQAPITELRNFYTIAHKLSGVDKASGKPELKIYPVVMNEMLFLNIDMTTNPVFRKYLNKIVPGTVKLKFAEYDALNIKFYPDTRSMLQDVKMLKSEGFVLTNEDYVKEQIRDLKLVKSKQ